MTFSTLYLSAAGINVACRRSPTLFLFDKLSESLERHVSEELFVVTLPREGWVPTATAATTGHVRGEGMGNGFTFCAFIFSSSMFYES